MLLFIVLCLLNFCNPDLPLAACNLRDRVQNLRQVCARNNYTKHKPVFAQFMVVDDRHKVIACMIPKAGCTSFRELLIRQTGRVPVNKTLRYVHGSGPLRKYGLHPLPDYSQAGIQTRLQKYHKLILVRHPLDRLISAYHEKFIVNAVYPKALNKTIMRKFGAKAVNFVNGVPRISFHQFLKLIIYYRKDRHWLPYMDICQPCNIQYDSILKLETLQTDLEQVLPLFLNPGQQSVPFPHGNRRRNETNKLSSVTETFRKLDPQLVKAVSDIYGYDMALFGYTWDNRTGAGCLSGNQVTCC